MDPENREPPLVEARGLRRTFGGRTAVDGVDLTIRRGEVAGFLGPNGAGKTTTLRMLAGLLVPTAGEVRIGGRDPFREGRETRRITGFAPDTPPLYDHLTARQHVEFVAELWDARDAGLAARVDALLRAEGRAAANLVRRREGRRLLGAHAVTAGCVALGATFVGRATVAAPPVVEALRADPSGDAGRLLGALLVVVPALLLGSLAFAPARRELFEAAAAAAAALVVGGLLLGGLALAALGFAVGVRNTRRLLGPER